MRQILSFTKISFSFLKKDSHSMHTLKKEKKWFFFILCCSFLIINSVKLNSSKDAIKRNLSTIVVKLKSIIDAIKLKWDTDAVRLNSNTDGIKANSSYKLSKDRILTVLCTTKTLATKIFSNLRNVTISAKESGL